MQTKVSLSLSVLLLSQVLFAPLGAEVFVGAAPIPDTQASMPFDQAELPQPAHDNHHILHAAAKVPEAALEFSGGVVIGTGKTVTSTIKGAYQLIRHPINTTVNSIDHITSASGHWMADKDRFRHSAEWIKEHCGTNLVDAGDCFAQTSLLLAPLALPAVKGLAAGSDAVGAGSRLSSVAKRLRSGPKATAAAAEGDIAAAAGTAGAASSIVGESTPLLSSEAPLLPKAGVVTEAPAKVLAASEASIAPEAAILSDASESAVLSAESTVAKADTASLSKSASVLDEAAEEASMIAPADVKSVVQAETVGTSVDGLAAAEQQMPGAFVEPEVWYDAPTEAAVTPEVAAKEAALTEAQVPVEKALPMQDAVPSTGVQAMPIDDVAELTNKMPGAFNPVLAPEVTTTTAAPAGPWFPNLVQDTTNGVVKTVMDRFDFQPVNKLISDGSALGQNAVDGVNRAYSNAQRMAAKAQHAATAFPLASSVLNPNNGA